jgi:hypothetical protein
MQHFRILLLFCLLFTISSCGLQEQRKQLHQEQMLLQQKEQELSLKEQELDEREAILNERQKSIDSVLVQKDTLSSLYPMVSGNWIVKMVCTETTCPGSALGDTKVEQWSVSFQNNLVVAKAMNNKMQLTRIYTGSIDATGQINLVAQSTAADLESSQSVKIIIQLKQRNRGSMDGQREIIQPGNCHIVYSLDLKRQN